MNVCRDCHRPADGARCALCTRIRQLEALLLPFGTSPDIVREFCGVTVPGNLHRLDSELLVLYARRSILMSGQRRQLADRELAWLEKAITNLIATPMAEHWQHIYPATEQAD